MLAQAAPTAPLVLLLTAGVALLFTATLPSWISTHLLLPGRTSPSFC
jgi:hypothetical protein